MKETNCMFSCVFFIKEFLDLLERHNALKSDFWAANMIYIFGIQMKKIYSIQKKKNRKSEQRFIQYLHVLHFNVFIYNHPYLVVQYFWFHSQPRKWKRPLRRQHLCRLSLGRNGQVCVCLHALIKMIILVYIVYT